MKLKEFAEEQRNLIDLFERWWIKENEKNSENFPMEMNEGDWNEQLWGFDPGVIDEA